MGDGLTTIRVWGRRVAMSAMVAGIVAMPAWAGVGEPPPEAPASKVHVQSIREPVYVDLRAGGLAECGAAPFQGDRADRFTADVVRAVDAFPRRIVVIHVVDRPYVYEQLAEPERAALQGAYGEDASRRYEGAMAKLLPEV